jgi:quercetin dioxygenase-like cupin family protein
MDIRIILPLLFAGAIAMCGRTTFAQTTGEVELTAEPNHHQAFENNYVRVFKVEVAPHASTLLHRHGHDYIFISLGPSQITNAVVGKPPVNVTLQDGEARFTPGNFAHVATNNVDTPFRNVTVEFLQDEAAHKNPPPPWDEERGLHVFDGGTQEIVFVKDGVRVTETELNPGAVMPRHHYIGPHLLVAVTDLDIRSDVEGQGPMPGHFKSGDVKWLPGDYSHTVTNTGKQKAKFVTLEFR